MVSAEREDAVESGDEVDGGEEVLAVVVVVVPPLESLQSLLSG